MKKIIKDLKKDIKKLKNDIIDISNNKEETKKLLVKLIGAVETSKINTIFNVGYNNYKSIDTDTFSIITTENGIIYKEHHHYCVFIEPTFFEGEPVGLFGALHLLFTLKELIEDKDSSYTEEEIKMYTELYENQLDVVRWVMTSPKIAAVNTQSMIDFATNTVLHFQKLQEECYSELKEETEEDIAKNSMFEKESNLISDLFKDLNNNETK